MTVVFSIVTIICAYFVSTACQKTFPSKKIKPFEIPKDVPPYPNMEWNGVTYMDGTKSSEVVYRYSSYDKMSEVVIFYAKNLVTDGCKLERVFRENEPIAGQLVFQYYCNQKRYYIRIHEKDSKTYITILETWAK